MDLAEFRDFLNFACFGTHYAWGKWRVKLICKKTWQPIAKRITL